MVYALEAARQARIPLRAEIHELWSMVWKRPGGRAPRRVEIHERWSMRGLRPSGRARLKARIHERWSMRTPLGSSCLKAWALGVLLGR